MIESVGRTGDGVVINGGDDSKVSTFQRGCNRPRPAVEVYGCSPRAATILISTLDRHLILPARMFDQYESARLLQQISQGLVAGDVGLDPCGPPGRLRRYQQTKKGNEALRQSFSVSHFTFPYDFDAPILGSKRASRLLVAGHIGFELFRPKLGPGRRYARFSASRMPMPEAAVDENHRPPRRGHQVRPPRQSGPMQPKAVTEPMQERSDVKFGPRVRRSHAAHVQAA